MKISVFHMHSHSYHLLPMRQPPKTENVEDRCAPCSTVGMAATSLLLFYYWGDLLINTQDGNYERGKLCHS